jgi:cytochrome d ubiquinol oxidase subunit II
MTLDLPFVWAGLIAFAVLAYVILDGFDLGIGIVFPWLVPGTDRDTAMNSVAPVWDGNETWLVLGGGGLYAAFPLAYAIVMPALYAPLIAMLIGLVLRGVAFEFRWRDKAHKPIWDAAFAGGSLLAAVAQGLALGALVQGIPVTGRAYGGGWFDWLTPFSLLTAAGLVSGYALLGSTWLVMKTEGDLRTQARGYSWWLAFVGLGFIGIISAVTPFLDPVFLQRWFGWPAILYSVFVPIGVMVCAWRLVMAVRERRDAEPFVMALCLFVLSFAGLGISFYPNILPPKLTIWEAAAPDSSLGFLLVGAGILIPIILGYTAYSYWVFRGKVDPEGGYH